MTAKRQEVFSGSKIGGAPGEIRTPDLLVRSQALYPTELRAQGARILPHQLLITIPPTLSGRLVQISRNHAKTKRISRNRALQSRAPGRTRTQESSLNMGGEGGIRTLEGLLTLTPLAGARLRPLGHLSGLACSGLCGARDDTRPEQSR